MQACLECADDSMKERPVRDYSSLDLRYGHSGSSLPYAISLYALVREIATETVVKMDGNFQIFGPHLLRIVPAMKITIGNKVNSVGNSIPRTPNPNAMNIDAAS